MHPIYKFNETPVPNCCEIWNIPNRNILRNYSVMSIALKYLKSVACGIWWECLPMSTYSTQLMLLMLNERKICHHLNTSLGFPSLIPHGILCIQSTLFYSSDGLKRLHPVRLYILLYLLPWFQFLLLTLHEQIGFRHFATKHDKAHQQQWDFSWRKKIQLIDSLLINLKWIWWCSLLYLRY